MSENLNSKGTMHEPMDKQLQTAEFNKYFLTERQRLEQELKKPYVKDITAENMDEALNSLAETPKEQIKYLNFSETLMGYVEKNNELTGRMNRVLDETAKTMVTLRTEANKRSTEILTPSKLKELLNSDLQVNVHNHNTDTIQKLETEFDLFVERVTKKLSDMAVSVENRVNLSIVLHIVTIIILTRIAV